MSSMRQPRWKPHSNAVEVPRLLGGRLSFALATLFACAIVAVAGTARSIGADEHPYVGLLSQDLLDAGIAPVALRIP